MKLTGPACTAALNGAEEARRRERAYGSAGGVRVERKVRPSPKQEPPEHTARLNLSSLTGERGTMLPTPKERTWSYCPQRERRNDG